MLPGAILTALIVGETDAEKLADLPRGTARKKRSELTAVHVKGSYLQAQFLRLKARRGAKKAILAVAASMLTAAYHMLKNGVEYRELGVDQ